MKSFSQILVSVFFMLFSGCAPQAKKAHQEAEAFPEYHLMLTAYDGPSISAGLAGWIVMEVDLPNSRMRLLQKRVRYTGFKDGIPPERPPYDPQSLAEAIGDITWKPLPKTEVISLHKLIDAWMKASPPANYVDLRDDLGWPGHTTITVRSSQKTVTSEMACKYSSPSYSEDTGSLRDLLWRLSYLANLWKEGTQQSTAADAASGTAE